MTCLYPFVTPELIAAELAANGWSASFGEEWAVNPVSVPDSHERLSSEHRRRLTLIGDWFGQRSSTNNSSWQLRRPAVDATTFTVDIEPIVPKDGWAG